MMGTDVTEATDQQKLDQAFDNMKAGKLDEARTAFAHFMHHPELGVDAHRGLAAIAWRRGYPDSATQLLNEAMRMDEEHADVRADLALVLMMSGKLPESIEQWKKRLELKPDDAGAWHNVATCFNEAKQLEPARQAFENAIRIAPKSGRSYVSFARAYEANGNRAAADEVWRRGLAACPGDQAMYLGLAQSLFQQSKLEESRAVFERGVTALPESPELRMGFGQLLDDFGDKSGAEREFRLALKMRPGWAMPLEGLLTLLRGESTPEDIALAQEILADPSRPVEDHANVGFGLGKCFDKQGRTEEAFQVWEQANKARRKQVGEYSPQRMTDYVDRVISQFSADFLQERAQWGIDDTRPIFIIGMPRSGTSLVEQILAAHPEVHGYGELPTIPQIARGLSRYSGSIHKWPESADSLSADGIRAAAEQYLSDIQRRHASQARRITDKAPTNFLYVGLIACLFPHARFVWCRRDPRDNGLSIFGENFGLAEKHATDLDAIGHYYQNYARLMRHWEQILGERIYQVRYEGLVDSFEAEVRQLVEFVGLPWNANCLRFFEDDRPVLTPSRWQVRSPVYKGAVGRWKRYEKQLAPLVRALGKEVNNA